jgi:RNA polymerase sigma-70 factor (ECF subfamily)
MTNDGAGDAERFDRLYRTHANAVLAYVRSRSGPEHAREVVEETFLVAWRRLDDLPIEPRAWLIGVARRLLANTRRAEARREALGVRILAEQAGDLVAGDPAEIVVERDASLDALTRISDADRELLALVAWGELSPAEAAKVLGCSRTAFLVRLHRARRRFEEALGRDDRSDETVRTVSVRLTTLMKETRL